MRASARTGTSSSTVSLFGFWLFLLEGKGREAGQGRQPSARQDPLGWGQTFSGLRKCQLHTQHAAAKLELEKNFQGSQTQKPVSEKGNRKA